MAERTRTLTIELLPDEATDDLRLDDFLEELDALRVALRETERLASGREPSLYFKIKRLQKASPATVELEAASTADDDRARPQGMNWIRPEKRLAIYLRDGLACCYCGAGVEQEVRLTLDHLRPYTSSGTNNLTNLITCCSRCNSARGARSWKVFATKVAGYVYRGMV